MAATSLSASTGLSTRSAKPAARSRSRSTWVNAVSAMAGIGCSMPRAQLERAHAAQGLEAVLARHGEVDQQDVGRLRWHEHASSAVTSSAARAEGLHHRAGLLERQRHDLVRVGSSSTTQMRTPASAPSAALRRCSALGRAGQRERGGMRRRRQVDGEGRAACRAPAAVRAHLPAVQQRDVAHQREADAQAAGAPRRGGVGLSEAVEHVRQEFRRDAHAVVACTTSCTRSPFFSSDTCTAPLLGRELHRVRQQVGQRAAAAARRRPPP